MFVFLSTKIKGSIKIQINTTFNNFNFNLFVGKNINLRLDKTTRLYFSKYSNLTLKNMSIYTSLILSPNYGYVRISNNYKAHCKIT